MNLAPTSCQTQLLLGSQPLIAKEDDQVINQSSADFRHRLVVDGASKIDPFDLCAECAGYGLCLKPAVTGVGQHCHEDWLPDFSVARIAPGGLRLLSTLIECPLRQSEPWGEIGEHHPYA